MDFKNIIRLNQLATKGPWISWVEGRDFLGGSSCIGTGEEYDLDFYNIKEVDQDFIAEARNIVPFLINEIERLKTILEYNKINY